MPKLNDLTIKNAKEGTYWDDTLKGFGLRVGKNRKTFMVLVASGRRHAIGHYPLMSLADARKEAKRILAEKMLGKVRPSQTAWDDAKEQYLEYCAPKLRQSTLDDYRKILARHFPFGRKSIGDITALDMNKRIHAMHHIPTRQRYAFATARAFFKWCTRQGILDRSPMEKLEVPRTQPSRERILTKNELCGLTQALRTHENTFTRICALLLYTGQRRGEIALLEWSWIDRTNMTITLPAPVTKNNTVHTFPYGPTVERVLDSIPQFKDCPYVFPAAKTVSEKTTVFNGWSKPKVALDKITGMTEWTLHDIRRSVSSHKKVAIK